MSILIIAEHDNHQLKATTLNTIAAAKQLQEKIVVLVAGHQCKTVVEKIKTIETVAEVLTADHPVYQHPLAETWAQLIVHISKQSSWSHILAPATTFGKNLMPRVAALLDAAQISDVVAILDRNTYHRPIYAGNAIATVRSLDALQVLTIRPTAFEAAECNATSPCPELTLDYVPENKLSKYIQTEGPTLDRPDLISANIVISGGRGLQSKENFDRVAAIADAMQAAIGASRAAVDAGFAPNDTQVGQTGKVVAPKLYIALGISGAIQHLAGMKESKIIIAVNKDPEATIFKVADYGLIADLQDVLSKWEQWLEKRVEK